MKLEDIRNPVGVLPGIGPAAAKLFANLNIFTVGDLLRFYPRDYEDRTRLIPLAMFDRAAKIHTVAKVTAHDWFGYGRMRTLKILIDDGTAKAELVAFNRPFLEKMLPPEAVIVVTGSFAVKYGSLQSTSFDAVKLADGGKCEDYAHGLLPDSGILPVYSLTEGLNQRTVRKTVAAALSQYAAGIDDELPADIIQKRQLLSKRKALQLIHRPAQMADIQTARRTLAYEELYRFQYSMAERTWKHKGSLPDPDLQAVPVQAPESEAEVNAAVFTDSLSPRQKQLAGRLPFPLTEDQMHVIFRMDSDIDRGYRDRTALLQGKNPNTAGSISDKPVYTMARLLQGDVGSGKTLVAFFACLRAVDWGGQCAFMAPTEILARKHAETAAALLEPTGIRIAFLTGNIQSAGRQRLLRALKAGDIDIVIGTHALFSADVQYRDLQLVVIDEQHRFGVMQRNAIVGKGLQIAGTRHGPPAYVSPHLLMLSATPIPQTLALTLFGDLDISSIHTMPAGRKPVTTYLVREGHEQNVYEAVRKELAAGHQAYFVYPLIDTAGNASQEAKERRILQPGLETTDSDKALKSAEAMFSVLSKQIYPAYPCALIHSKVGEDEQNKTLSDFRAGRIRILVATTVVEVGVDVPNATCMVIEQADRFGLAQLHQLRGRVGRGNSQSYCFLIYNKNISDTGIERMKALRETTDGFSIAEKDLKLRGPGEITGTIQAGNLMLGIADLDRDRDILLEARSDAFAAMQRTLQDGRCGQDDASGR